MNAHLRAFRTLLVYGALALLITTVLTTTAAAFNCLDGTGVPNPTCPQLSWPGGAFTYRTNAASFGTNLQNGGVGLSLTQTQVDYWIPHALNMWRERTGIGGGLNFIYDGGSSTASHSSCRNFDGFSQVYAVAGCHPTLGCSLWAITQPSVNANGFTETDICVYGGSVGAVGSGCLGQWRVRADTFPSNDKDLIGILVHELGHALGLDHTNNTVMDPAALGCGNTLARFPYGDDIRGMRTIYPVDTSRLRMWSEMTSTTWSSPVAISGAAYTHTRAAVGKRGSSSEAVVSTRIGLNGDAIHFTRTTYPISSGSTWANVSYSQNTWRPPSVAGRPSSYSSSELWVAAWAQELQFASDCNPIRVGVSTNAFATMPTVVDLDAHCGSIHEPALTFDKNSGRFVLFYVRHIRPINTQLNVGMIYARTSTDGVTWTAPQELGAWAIDAVDIACASSGGTCLLAYVRGNSNDPKYFNRAFTVSTSGNIVLGAYTLDPDYTEWSAATGVRTFGGVNDWFLSAPMSSCTTHGSCDNFTTRDPIIPFPNFTSAGVIGSSLRGTFASVPEFSRMYSWVVQ